MSAILTPQRPEANAVSTPQGNLAQLIKLQGAQLVRDHGEPICPSEVAQYLRAIDERLFMRAFPFPQGWEWAICESWGENDPRRMSIRMGEIPADRAFDVIGYVPSHLKITSAEEAAGFLASSLRSNLRDRPDFEKYLNAVTSHNIQQSERNVQPIKDYAQELAEANTATLFAEQGKTVPKVFMNEPADTTGRKRAKGRAADIPKPS